MLILNLVKQQEIATQVAAVSIDRTVPRYLHDAMITLFSCLVNAEGRQAQTINVGD